MIIYLNLSHYALCGYGCVCCVNHKTAVSTFGLLSRINMNPFPFGCDDCCGNQINLLQSNITSVFDVANSFILSFIFTCTIVPIGRRHFLEMLLSAYKLPFSLSPPPSLSLSPPFSFHFILFLFVLCASLLHSTSLLATEVTMLLFVPFSISFVLTFGIFYTTHLS